MDKKEKTINKLHKAFKELGSEGKSFPAIFSNDDVPKFLKRLERFEKESEKVSIMLG